MLQSLTLDDLDGVLHGLCSNTDVEIQEMQENDFTSGESPCHGLK